MVTTLSFISYTIILLEYNMTHINIFSISVFNNSNKDRSLVICFFFFCQMDCDELAV